jgi:hypothetical protein
MPKHLCSCVDHIRSGRLCFQKPQGLASEQVGHVQFVHAAKISRLIHYVRVLIKCLLAVTEELNLLVGAWEKVFGLAGCQSSTYFNSAHCWVAWEQTA